MCIVSLLPLFLLHFTLVVTANFSSYAKYFSFALKSRHVGYLAQKYRFLRVGSIRKIKRSQIDRQAAIREHLRLLK